MAKKKSGSKGKKSKNNGFIWGLIFGAIIAAGAIYYYNNYMKKSDFEKKTEKLEKKAKKGIDEAKENAKKLFDK